VSNIEDSVSSEVTPSASQTKAEPTCHASVSGGNSTTFASLSTTADCSSPAIASTSASTGKCKHLWATILEADRRGALAEAVNAKYLTIEDNISLDDPAALGDLTYRDRLFAARASLPPSRREFLCGRNISPPSNARFSTSSLPPRGPREFEILYMLDKVASRAAGAIVLELFSRTRKKNGEWSAEKGFKVSPAQAGSLPDPIDADVVGAMLGGMESYAYYSANGASTRKTLPAALALKIIPTIAATGRLRLRADLSAKESPPLLWDSGEPWKFYLDVRQGEGEQWSIQGSLRRGDERMDVHEPLLLLECGLLVTPGLRRAIRHRGRVPLGHKTARSQTNFVSRFRARQGFGNPARRPGGPAADSRRRPSIRGASRSAALRAPNKAAARRSRRGVLSSAPLARLRPRLVGRHASGSGVWLRDQRVYVLRDRTAEACGARNSDCPRTPPREHRTAPLASRDEAHAARRARTCFAPAGTSKPKAKHFSRPGAPRVDVSSGIDWFELRAEVDYGDTTISLPVLLEAMRRGDNMVPLGDGSFGLLPEEWLSRFAPLAGLGTKQEAIFASGAIRPVCSTHCSPHNPKFTSTKCSRRVREGLHRFQGVRAAPQPEGFVGTLRDYQREGVGWMEVLREFGFGGCLADDMGVGKTAQVLAVLESRRAEGKGPSLVVAPKSLMFNWRAEAGPLHAESARPRTHRPHARCEKDREA
jgi:hypothetical protein